jgi:hypothetical protein
MLARTQGSGAAECRHSENVCVSRPWARESEMLPSVLAHRRSLAPGTGWRPFYEVPGPLGGIVDLIWVRFSRAALAGRPITETDTVLDLTSIRALLALNSDVSIDSLAAYTGVGSGHLIQNVLPRLVDAGWVERAGRSWFCSRPYRSPVTAAVAVELKRGDWRTALKQAARHRLAADNSWVVLDARRAKSAASAGAAPFVHAGVGLATLSQCRATDARSSQLSVIHCPSSGHGRDLNVAGRAFFGEQCLRMWLQGNKSGPERHVFGRLLGRSSSLE